MGKTPPYADLVENGKEEDNRCPKKTIEKDATVVERDHSGAGNVALDGGGTTWLPHVSQGVRASNPRHREIISMLQMEKQGVEGSFSIFTRSNQALTS